jgi:hypothetical protein
VDRSLGAYSLHEPLGRGASGEVWRGASRLDGSAVAVKVLRPELADDPDAVARLLGEREVLTGIESPHLVPVRDVVVEGDAVAVVMDLAAGVDLRRLLRSSPTQPPALACDIAAQVAAGLAAVHEAGVVHRDVKPENVLVDLSTTDAPLVRLTDFGVAGVVAEAGAARSTGVVGTPEYLAPEVAEGATASPAADIYSLGILLYELCAGRTPFAGGHPVAVLRRQLEDPPLRPPGLPAPIWGLLSWMLDKSPSARPSAEEVGEALADLAEAFVGRPALEPLPAFEAEDATDPGAAAVPPPPPALPPSAAPRPFRLGARGHRPPAVPVPHRRGSRALLFAAPLLVALVAAAVVGIQRLEGSPSEPYRFAPFLLDNGLAVERTWRFGDDDGAVLLGTAEVHNRTGRSFTGAFDEVLPASMVRDPGKVQRSPAGESPPNPIGDPVLRFAITDLDPGYFWRISYRVEVPAEGTGSDRLERWAADQRMAFERWGTSRGGRAQGVPNVLVDFDVDGPELVTLPVGARYQLPLVGRMADGSAAPAAVLALVRWESDDPAVATVRSGLVEAHKEGSTDIRAQTDELDGWSGSVEVVPQGTADVPESSFTLPSSPRLAPDAPVVGDITREDGAIGPSPSAPACANDRDDDGDGLTDGDDPGCASEDDDDEGGDPPLACANGVDDDGDGLMDIDDPGCASAEDDDETDLAAACANGLDDDGDGRVDLLDPGCTGSDDADETDPPPVCANGVDDDGDGSVDLDDPGCDSAEDTDEGNLAAACDNDVDDDGDGAIDLDDPGCTSEVDLDESGSGLNTLPACSNGVDDDGDGPTDLADLGCESPLDQDETERDNTGTTLPPPLEPDRGVAGEPAPIGA